MMREEKKQQAHLGAAEVDGVLVVGGGAHHLVKYPPLGPLVLLLTLFCTNKIIHQILFIRPE